MPSRMPPRTPSHLYGQMKIKLCEQIVAKEIRANNAARSIGKSRQIVHRWLKIFREYGPDALASRKPGPKDGTAWNRTAGMTENLVSCLASEFPFLGPIALAQKLEEKTGETLDQSTIYRILKRAGHRYAQRPQISRRKPILYVKSVPGEEVQMDTFYPFGRSRRLVGFDAIDDHSRWPESRLYETREEKNAIHFLHYLVARSPFRIRAIRTDRGREFSRKFTEACKALGIEHIRNRGYSPENNGKIERWHRTLREDLVRPLFHSNAPLEELRYLLGQWLHFFRFRRRHTGLGMNVKTPAQRLIEHYLNPTDESVNLILQQNRYCQLINKMI